MDPLEEKIDRVFDALISGVKQLEKEQADECIDWSDPDKQAILNRQFCGMPAGPSAEGEIEIPGVGEVLLDAREIRDTVIRLGLQINRDYADKEIVVVCVLKGAFVFCADLVRQLDMPHTVEFMRVKSYAGTEQGDLKVLTDLDTDIRNKHVLIVEDIVDSGVTLAKLTSMLRARGPASLEICAMLRKPSCIKVDDLAVKYVGKDIPNKWVVGYGLDNDEKMRGVPVVGVLKQ